MQKKSPSGTGFLKLNPYTARWSFIGTDKAKDKVGHALRKAVMNSQGGGTEDDSRQEEGSQSGDSLGRTSSSSKRKSVQQTWQKSSKRNNAAAAAAAPPVSILKTGDAAVISSRASRYAPGRLSVDTAASASGVPSAETDLTNLSKLFASPGAGTLMMRHQNTTPSDANYLGLGLSPVARDIFDEKNLEHSDSPSRHRRRGGGGGSSLSSRNGSMNDQLSAITFSLPPPQQHDMDSPSSNDPHLSGHGDSYPDQRTMSLPQQQHVGLIPPTFHPAHHHQPHYSSHQLYHGGAPYFYPMMPPPPGGGDQQPMLPPPPPPPHLGGHQPQGGQSFVLSPRRRRAAAAAAAAASGLPPEQQPQSLFRQEEMTPPTPPVMGGPLPGHPPPPPPPGMYYPPGYYYYYPGYFAFQATAGDHPADISTNPPYFPGSAPPGMVAPTPFQAHLHPQHHEENNHRTRRSRRRDAVPGMEEDLPSP